MNHNKYFEKLVIDVKNEYNIANSARIKGVDYVDRVEVPLAMSLAEKTISLISTVYPQLGEEKISIISQRILELEKKYGQLDPCVSLKIAEEIALEKYCKFDNTLQAIDAGIRVGFAYITLGVVSSPIEGFTGVSVCKTMDEKEYLRVNYSGPIRSAGGTGAAFSLIIVDYLRELFGYSKYDPNEKEIKRTITEITDYHERINNLQYFPTEEEMIFLVKNIPIEISGEPSEEKDVSNFKDLPRIETNRIRGGMCLVIAEGLAQKAAKISRMIKIVKGNGFKLSGWDFLEEYIELHKKRERGTKDTTATYIKDLVAGRPVFGHPSHSGSFRFRYGHSRVSGFSAASIHPATMFVSNCFLSSGNQLKIEKPIKGCIVTSCDTIDGPIVKLRNGSVKKISNLDESKKIYKDIEEIIYIGDILFSIGDIINRNAELPMPGYVEEWWGLELDKKIKTSGEVMVIDEYSVSLFQAIDLSKRYSLPMHPSYIFYWTQIKKEDFVELIEWVANAQWNGKLILPYFSKDRSDLSVAKRALEVLGVEHIVCLDSVVVDKGEAFLINLGMDITSNFKERCDIIIKSCKNRENVLEIVNLFSKYLIKDKAGDFIGARMGRPEKAKLRKLTGSPNALFPVGEQGGRFKSINIAAGEGFVKADFPIYFCGGCNLESAYRVCEKCGGSNIKKYYCLKCAEVKKDKNCSIHGPCRNYSNRKVDIVSIFNNAVNKVCNGGTSVPDLIKGIKGTNNEGHCFEDISKGILRAKYNLCVNKDGTIRYDATEIPITHFKPKEIGISVEQLISFGYTEDVSGVPLENIDQVVRLMPHDIILPCCQNTKDEKADDVFFNISKFIDEELEKVYGLPKYYNLKKKEDLVGQLVVCMAPHNCAGVVGRILGFCELQGLVASPFMHAAMRRDCDGDEAAIMMLMDVLLNFSRSFLPSHRGGTQDAPLVLNAHIRAGEVDDQILDFEICSSYPLSLYELAEQRKHSSEVKINTVKTLLKEGLDPFEKVGFTHDTSNFNFGVINSSYKVLPTMKEKVEAQMDLAEKLRAVDASDVARLIIERHFIRDIRGNLRKFSRQEFRCVSCNEKFRRPPLAGVCYKCGGKIIFTISEGSIKKYLEQATFLSNKYEIPAYTRQSLKLIKQYIESIFGKDLEKQVGLGEYRDFTTQK